MSRQAVYLALGVTGALIVFIVLIVRDPAPGLDQDATRDTKIALSRLADSLNKRLALLEQRMDGLSLGTASASETDGESSNLDAASAAAESQDTATLLAKLQTNVDDLTLRIVGLEDDPIQRGFNYLDSETDELRRRGVLALEDIAKFDPEARQAIRDMLNDPSAEVRRVTLDTLADLGDKEAIGEVMMLLDDNDASVRRESITTLQRLDADNAGESITQLIQDGDTSVRERAVDAVGSMKFRGSSALLLNALNDPSEDVRGQAIASLGEVGASEAAPMLRQMYESDPGRHKYRLVMSLKRLGDQQPWDSEVRQLSTVALQGRSEDERRRAIRSLRWYARKESTAVFQQALDDPSDRVRAEAERALGRGRRR